MHNERGFTLIELLVTIAIIGILASIGYPNYTDYIRRSSLSEATSAMADWRVRLEQRYQDDRAYGPTSADQDCTIGAPQASENFTFACKTVGAAGQQYLITATGRDAASGFVFTLNEANNKRTTALPSAWGTVPSGGYAKWVTKKGDTGS